MHSDLLITRGQPVSPPLLHGLQPSSPSIGPLGPSRRRNLRRSIKSPPPGFVVLLLDSLPLLLSLTGFLVFASTSHPFAEFADFGAAGCGMATAACNTQHA